jgi:hypothetical protein
LERRAVRVDLPLRLVTASLCAIGRDDRALGYHLRRLLRGQQFGTTARGSVTVVERHALIDSGIANQSSRVAASMMLWDEPKAATSRAIG